MATSIIATGSQLPKRIVKNEEIEKELMLKPGWIKHRCGVVQRHFLDNESFLDMAVLAAKNALEKSLANANDIYPRYFKMRVLCYRFFHSQNICKFAIGLAIAHFQMF